MAAVDAGGAKPAPGLGGPGQGRRQGPGRTEEARRLRSVAGSRVLRRARRLGGLRGSRRRASTRSSAETDHASLADDSTYQKWTKAVGDSGVVNLYAAPAAGDYLAHQLGDLENNLGGFRARARTIHRERDELRRRCAAYHSKLTVSDDGASRPGPRRTSRARAATIRFTGDGLELATASDPALSQGGADQRPGWRASSQALPDDTAAAIGRRARVGLADRDSPTASRSTPGARAGQQLLDQLGRESGLDLPGDVETLLGSVDRALDRQGLRLRSGGDVRRRQRRPGGGDGQGRPGRDREGARQAPRPGHGRAATLGSDTSGDLVAIGPDGGLPAAGAGRWPPRRHRRVPQRGARRGDASVVVYVDVDDLRQGRLQVSAGRPGGGRQPRRRCRRWASPSWTDGDVARSSLKISTN